MVWIEDYLYKDRKEKKTPQPFPREEHLEKVFLTGSITSSPKITVFGQEKLIIKVSINNYPISFWTPNFGLDTNIARLYEELKKTGVHVKAHGDCVNVGSIEFKGVTCSWEISRVKEQFLIYYVPKEKT